MSHPVTAIAFWLQSVRQPCIQDPAMSFHVPEVGPLHLQILYKKRQKPRTHGLGTTPLQRILLKIIFYFKYLSFEHHPQFDIYFNKKLANNVFQKSKVNKRFIDFLCFIFLIKVMLEGIVVFDLI